MKFLINLIAIGLLSFISGRLGLWEWDFTVIAFLVAFLVADKGARSYAAAFLAISVIWYMIAMMTTTANEAQLAIIVRDILKIPSVDTLLFATATIGGLVAGFSALTGVLARQAFLPVKERRRRR